jgi:superoxide dismutase, Fe-Mn family
MAYELAPLPYDYAALEPFIDADTMKFHHDKHHQAYINNVNAALADYPSLAAKPIDELMRDLDHVPEGVGGEPTGAIGEQIAKDFEGGFEAFKKAFNDAGAKQFGSGWAWLVYSDGKLKVTSSANQDTPLSQGLHPILGNDVWEHAYYLKYQNLRPKYLEAWWNVVNWTEANKRFAAAKG